MHDIIRILLYIVSFAASAYALSGVHFEKIARRHSETKIQLLYVLLSLALAYGVAQFLMGISRYAVI